MIRAFQWDFARQVERLDRLLDLLPRYADWGYQELYLHLEDAVEYPSLPGVARAGAYSYREFEALVRAASRAGLRVVPIVNLLGHTQYLVKVPALRDLNELRAPDGTPLERGQICPLHPRTLEVAGKLLRDVAPFCTAGKVHVGLDESFHLGRHPLSRADIAAHGLAAHFAGYAGRLHALTRELGLRMGLWADMLYHVPEAIPLLPRDVIAYDWYYHPFRRHPRVELFNFAERDLAAPLRAQGIEYWGCPMNGAFRHEPMPVFGERLANIRSWWDRCRRTDAGGMLVTSWEPQRLAFELTTLVDAAAAGLWLHSGPISAARLLSGGFNRAFGTKNSGQLARLALAADAHAFAGYARWELNERWDAGATREDSERPARDLRFFDRFARRALVLPAPFAASVGFCRYLAGREVFVRRAAQGVFQLRRDLARGPAATPAFLRHRQKFLKEAHEFGASIRDGRVAARAMWARTRRRAELSPNQAVLDQDAMRLKAWRRWLARLGRQPGLARESSPVCGAWQLRFVVHNFAPALQKVVVEQQGADGSWGLLGGRFTIEFRAAAARPHTGIRREFSVPVGSPSAALRIAVRGIGQVGISRIELTDGVTSLRPRRWPAGDKKIIGRPAPRRGLPFIDLSRNEVELPLAFGLPPAS